jgi:hypothetical protein
VLPCILSFFRYSYLVILFYCLLNITSLPQHNYDKFALNIIFYILYSSFVVTFYHLSLNNSDSRKNNKIVIFIDKFVVTENSLRIRNGGFYCIFTNFFAYRQICQRAVSSHKIQFKLYFFRILRYLEFSGNPI